MSGSATFHGVNKSVDPTLTTRSLLARRSAGVTQENDVGSGMLSDGERFAIRRKPETADAVGSEIREPMPGGAVKRLCPDVAEPFSTMF